MTVFLNQKAVGSVGDRGREIAPPLVHRLGHGPTALDDTPSGSIPPWRRPAGFFPDCTLHFVLSLEEFFTFFAVHFNIFIYFNFSLFINSL